jgi:acetyl esterase/lipase
VNSASQSHPAWHLALLLSILAVAPSMAVGQDAFTRTRDVVYGHIDGTALVMDVFRPDEPNSRSVIVVVSGGYFSSRDMIQPDFYQVLLERGYTVFAVLPGSQPRYQIPEIARNLKRAVRYIRHHAEELEIDPDRIGICGGSAGGNLGLLVATAGDPGDPDAEDPVDRQSSRVQAAAVFFPPTDFFNWGEAGQERIKPESHLPPFRPAFDYREMDRAKGTLERITDPERLREITRSISPIYWVSQDDPPALLIHGDQDPLVPLQQSESFVVALRESGGVGELMVVEGAGHGWPGMNKDTEKVADWFDQYLSGNSSQAK